MFEQINEVAVIGCTLCMLALYVLWYAAWGKGRGAIRSEMSELLLVGASLFVVVSACAYVKDAVAPLGTSPFMFALVLTCTTIFSLVPILAQEGKRVKEILIHAGYAVILCTSTVYTLQYWPW